MSTMTKGLDMINEMMESLKYNQMGNENSHKSRGGAGGAGIWGGEGGIQAPSMKRGRSGRKQN
jgi:hypothetical protein